MNKKNLLLITLLFVILIISGCNSKEKSVAELEKIMNLIVETEHNQSFNLLIDSLLANEQNKEVLELASDELNKSQKELNSLSVKTKKAKEVVKYYEKALDKRKKVILMLKDNKLTDENKEEFEAYLIEAEENEYKATGIIVNELNIKDIEN